MTLKTAEKEDLTEVVMWFTGEHKEVLAGSVDFWAFGGRLGVNLKPDWSGNVTVTRGRQVGGELWPSGQWLQSVSWPAVHLLDLFPVHTLWGAISSLTMCLFKCFLAWVFLFKISLDYVELFFSLLNVSVTAQGLASYIYKQKACQWLSLKTQLRQCV